MILICAFLATWIFQVCFWKGIARLLISLLFFNDKYESYQKMLLKYISLENIYIAIFMYIFAVEFFQTQFNVK